MKKNTIPKNAVANVLKDVLKLFKKRKTWIRGISAASEHFKHKPRSWNHDLVQDIGVVADSKLATCWCLTGAIERVVNKRYKNLSFNFRNQIRNSAIENLGKNVPNGFGVIWWNDLVARDKRDVTRLVKKTLKSLKK